VCTKGIALRTHLASSRAQKQIFRGGCIKVGSMCPRTHMPSQHACALKVHTVKTAGHGQLNKTLRVKILSEPFHLDSLNLIGQKAAVP